MTEIRVLPTDLKEQLKIAIRLSQQEDVTWIVSTYEEVKRISDLLSISCEVRSVEDDEVVLESKNNIQVVRQHESETPFTLDYGLRRRWFKLPSGAVVGRLVPVSPESSGRLVYIATHPSYRAISSAQEVIEPVTSASAGNTSVDISLLDATQLSDWKTISSLVPDNLNQALLFYSVILTWESDIFKREISLAAANHNLKNYYSQWISPYDLDSINNLSYLIYTNRNDLDRWAIDNKLSPEKVSEIWRYYIRLLRKFEISNVDIIWTKIDWDTIMRQLKHKKIKLSETERLVRSPLHEGINSTLGDEVIPIVFHESNSDLLIDLFMTSKAIPLE